MTLNKGEYGQIVYVPMGEDVSSATSTTIILTPQVGEAVETTSGVSVGTSNITVGDETYTANEYLKYTIRDGDLDYAGRWRFNGEAVLSTTKKVIGDKVDVTVLA
jgi:hypothetical protein